MNFHLLKSRASKQFADKMLKAPDHPWLQGSLVKAKNRNVMTSLIMIHHMGHKATPDKIRFN